MKKRISRKNIISKFGRQADCWTDVVATNKQNPKERFHLTKELRFNERGKHFWLSYIETL